MNTDWVPKKNKIFLKIVILVKVVNLQERPFFKLTNI